MINISRLLLTVSFERYNGANVLVLTGGGGKLLFSSLSLIWCCKDWGLLFALIHCSWCCVRCFLNSYLNWLKNSSKSLRKSNQLTLAGVGTNIGPLAKTDFCEGIRSLVDKLIAFWSGEFSLIFLILSLKLHLSLFLFSRFFLSSWFREKRLFFLWFFSAITTLTLSFYSFRLCLFFRDVSIVFNLRWMDDIWWYLML